MLVLDILLETWLLLNQISIYLIFGFLIAGILSVYVPKNFIEKNLGKKSGFLSVFKASILGVPLPLCSCSVIPVAASLKQHGASKGAISSFLLSTPQTGVDSIMVTYGLLGPIVALIRPIIALITGLVGGIFVQFFDQKIEDSIQETCRDHCCGTNERSILWRIFNYSFVVLPKDIAKPLIYGILIASCINLLLPDTIFMDYMGDGILSMLFMILIGTPIYVCATASIPIALAMMSKGATLGAVMVFLMVGPATNITSISTMFKILGKKSTILTLFILVFLSLFFGSLVNNLTFINANLALQSVHSHSHHTSNFHSFFSVIFIGILINTVFIPKFFNK